MNPNEPSEPEVDSEAAEPVDPCRRAFLTKVSIGLSGLIACAVAPPIAAAVVQPLLQRKGHEWREIGPLESFEEAKTVLVNFENTSVVPWAGDTARTGAWLRRIEGENFEAFTLNCAHLGCPVRWEGDAELFLCPCHGGVYYKDGTVAGGPPPKALAKYPVKVSEGRVYVKAEPVPITTMKG